jgi:hypothetical protein
MTRISKESKVVPVIDAAGFTVFEFFSTVLTFTMQLQMEPAAYLLLLWRDMVCAQPSQALLLPVNLRRVM